MLDVRIRVLFQPEASSREVVAPSDVLQFRPRRALPREDEGRLQVLYGGRALTFEGERAVAFGRHLLRHQEFLAGVACAWSDGEPHPWEEVRALLEELLAQGVLERPGTERASGDSPLHHVPADATAPPLRWQTLEEGCRFVGQAHGLTFGPDQLETALGASGLSNLARDETGRQIGENTVALRDPALAELVPTEWKRCPFPGSRHEDPRPMNVTALRQMTGDLDQTLAGMEALRRRFVARQGGRQPVLGELYLLARVGAALPAWLLCRPLAPVPNGAIPSWVGSLQKLVGGVNMPITCMMLDLGYGFEARVTADQVLRVTEELGLFLTSAGVCSGTPKMVERSVQAVLEGSPRCDDELLAETLGDVDGAIDYGLHASLVDLCRWACRLRMRLVTTAALATGAGAGRESVERLRQICAQANEECAPQRELWFIHAQVEAIAAMGLQGEVDPGEPPAPPAGTAPLQGALQQVLWLERRGLQMLEALQADLNARLNRPHTGPLTREQFALGERRQEVPLWSAALEALTS